MSAAQHPKGRVVCERHGGERLLYECPTRSRPTEGLSMQGLAAVDRHALRRPYFDEPPRFLVPMTAHPDRAVRTRHEKVLHRRELRVKPLVEFPALREEIGRAHV